MKKIKYVFVLALSISFVTISAQEKKIKFNKGTLKICSSKSFVIEGYDGNEVIIESLHSKRNLNTGYVTKVGTSSISNNKKDKSNKGKWEVLPKVNVIGFTSDNSKTLDKKKEKGEWEVSFVSDTVVYSIDDAKTALVKDMKAFKKKSNATSYVVSGAYSENDTLKPKRVFFNNVDAKRKEGLKKLGKKNENKELEIYFIIEQNGDELIFRDNTESNFIMSANREQYKIKIPNSLRLEWKTDCAPKEKEKNYFFFNSEKSSLSNFDGEVAISTSIHNIKLLDVTGPVSINTIGGNVTIEFDNKTPKKLYSIYSNNGFIDISLPRKSDINVDATASDIFSNIDFKVEKESEEAGLQHMKLNLNGGKVRMKLNANLGNIYLRNK
jgi:hypothetical protein